MALYDSTGINNNVIASVFNKLYSQKFVNTIRRRNSTLYAILGKQEIGQTPGLESFEGLVNSEGNNIEVRVMGKLRTVPTVANATAAIATATLSYDADVFGAMTFDYTHFADTLPIPTNDLLKIRGNMTKTASYIDDLFNHVVFSLESTLGNAITAVPAGTFTAALFTTGTRTTMVSLFNAISDGTSTFSTTNVNYFYPATDSFMGRWYGNIDRNDSTNAQFRSAVYGGTSEASAGAGQLTLSKLYTLMNRQIALGGNPTIAISDALVHGYIQALTASAAQVIYETDTEFNTFGGRYLNAFGMKFLLEQRLGNQAGTVQNSCGTLFLLDPTYWKMYRSDQNLSTAGVVVDPSRVASSVLPYQCLTQLVCLDPAKGGSKMIGITG
jgi:hypothetical protein